MKNLSILVGGQVFEMYGGSFFDAPTGCDGWVTVNMAAEIELPADISIPTRDFRTPNNAQLIAGLQSVVIELFRGNQVFVGCMAGRGRTGLFLACFTAATFEASGSQPNYTAVNYVRTNYYEHAVETDEQMRYVETRNYSSVVAVINTLDKFPILARFPKGMILALSKLKK